MTTTTTEPFVFSPGTATGPEGADRPDRLVNDTRREIAEIVREVAVAVRSDRTANEFFGLLVDRIQRAMAAEGVIVWVGSPADDLVAVRRLGRITDQSIPHESTAAHRRLLAEVASEGQPVVVPATPGATDADVPANPMNVPVALVPIELEPSVDGPVYLLEVFLESDCGVATQRGYLRFVAQMADLAGEFLRSDQLRSLRRRQQIAGLMDDAVLQLHRIDSRTTLEAAIVDRVADLFGFDRVGLCVGEPTKLIAVSHVESIDSKSDSARQLCDAAGVEVDADGCRWYDPNESKQSTESDDAELIVRAVVTDPLNPVRKLVCLQVADVEPIAAEYRDDLVRFMQHADMAIEHAANLSSIPGGRLLAALSPRTQSSRTTRRRKILTATAVSTFVLVAALFPVPLVVSSVATIRPEKVQSIAAPRDSVVDQIHVGHGQTVSAGDMLITLVDPDLEEQATALIGRRAVLVQQKSHWTDALVDTASHEMDRLEKVQGERQLVSEEIQSIDDQLAVLRRAEETLKIRATRNGIIDAWRIEQRLQSRPLKRGDQLMQVIATDSPWSVEARVPRTRIAHLNNATSQDDLFVNVTLDSDPTQTFQANVARIGPAFDDKDGSPKSTAVLLRLDGRAATVMSKLQQTSHQSGAPARTMFHCGTAPAGYVLFQDLIRSVRGTAALYFGGKETDRT